MKKVLIYYSTDVYSWEKHPFSCNHSISQGRISLFIADMNYGCSRWPYQIVLYVWFSRKETLLRAAGRFPVQIPAGPFYVHALLMPSWDFFVVIQPSSYSPKAEFNLQFRLIGGSNLNMFYYSINLVCLASVHSTSCLMTARKTPTHKHRKGKWVQRIK